MPSTVVIGAQWGDEGKGKVVDYLAERATAVVRFNGGNNAGHSIQVGDKRVAVHLVPAGAMRDGVSCVIANGCVIDMEVLAKEISSLKEATGQSPDLLISDRAHVIMPYHKVIDGLQEERRGSSSIGTTRRGNGPAYADKYSRCGITVADVINLPRTEEKVLQAWKEKCAYIIKVLGGHSTGEDPLEYCLQFKGMMEQYATDTSGYLNDLLDDGHRVLFEGAHGSMLDIDHGDYPFVTSSCCLAGGITPGAGVCLRQGDESIGVVKAYSTRIGAGPFPTEVSGDLAHTIRERGREYGTTTGRPRRIGWLDGPSLRYSCRVNGFSYLALTLLDVLTGLDEIRICTQHTTDGESSARDVVYDGWKQDISSCRDFADLPPQAQMYVGAVERLVGLRVGILSVGPGRDQLIDLRKEW